MDEQEEGGRKVARGLVVLVLAVIGTVGALVLAYVGKALYVDWLWFESLGFQNVYVKMLWTKTWLFVAGGGLFFAFFLANVLLARRLAARRWGQWTREASEADAADEEERPVRDATVAIAVVGGLAALAFGLWTRGYWEAVIRLPHHSPFGVTDPLFGRDVSFFVFQLPLQQALRSWLLWTVGLTLFAVLAAYFYRLVVPQSSGAGFAVDEDTGERKVSLAFGAPIRAHLSLLGAAYLLVLAWHYRLKMYELLFSTRGAAAGAGYTDVNAYWPALWVLLAIAVIGALALAAGTIVRGPMIAVGIVALFFPVWLIGTLAYPWFVQRFHVVPNELEQERPFIERNIQYTRRAYGLDRVQESPFPVAEAVSRAEVEANPATLRNIRLWDYEPLLATYNQVQSIRGYYDFLDADFDRYLIDGEYRQVMIAVRELSPHKLPADAQTWVNRRLQFTHGYGVVVSPVNEVTPEGLPTLIVQDVPPRGKIPITRPEVYYGEAAGGWVVVNTAVPEFDYPRGEQNVETTYKTKSGVGVGSFFRRVLFAWHLNDLNLLVTPALRPESQLLFHRNIHERVRKVAPFLFFDGDPYVVVHEGKLVWLYDAYTYSGHYPYSQPAARAFNYLRNSVKVAIDAYDGSMVFYVADEEDPIIRAYAQAFPDLFRPMSDMPAGLRAHIRYPGTIFRVQAQMYRLYHMQDPRVFYQREDQLMIPTEIYLGAQRPVPVQPYYVIMRLPGEPREEFVYVLPYTPPGKDNMITWLAARSDGQHYGKLVAYKYPKETLIFGPMQVEARIDQDPTISAQFTLWNQGGSRVLRGNMLAIPIGSSNLYVEPVYLQAERSRLPEMKRVIVATGNRVAMGLTVEDALAQLYDGPITFQTAAGPVTAGIGPPPATTGTPAGQPGTTPPGTATQPGPAQPAQAGAAQPGTVTAPASGTTAIDNAALLQVVRSMLERNQRMQEEMSGLQTDLRRLVETLEQTR